MNEEELTLEGVRILIVEDHYVVADALRFLLTSYGSIVTAAVPDVPRALRAIEENPVDIAVLDIDLNGTTVVPFAEHLASKHVPFVFLTGYGDENLLPGSLRERPRFDKPVRDDHLVRKMMDLLRPAADSGRDGETE